jgi:hypothetical protein
VSVSVSAESVQTQSRPTAALSEIHRTTDRWLVRAGAFFTVAVLIHNFDHVRRGANSVGRDVFAIGSAGIVFEVGIVILVMQRHRLAPIAAVITGFPLAAGYVLVHFTPQRTWLSDSFPSAAHVNPFSWFAASLEVVAALALGTVGLIALQRRGGWGSGALPDPDQRTAAAVIRDPFVLAMVLGNVILMVVSVTQLL